MRNMPLTMRCSEGCSCEVHLLHDGIVGSFHIFSAGTACKQHAAAAMHAAIVSKQQSLGSQHLLLIEKPEAEPCNALLCIVINIQDGICSPAVHLFEPQ